jgi:GNAT superfamily N-acetyltransferase
MALELIEKLAAQGIGLRPITNKDLPFLCRVYSSTRMDELAVTNWTSQQKEAFLAAQFEAQHQHYQSHYNQTAYWIILRKGEELGRLYLAHWETELRIVDIALLPSYRKQGIGSTIIEAILQEGERLALPVRIHVEIFNPALRLYKRLGFEQIEDKGVYYFLEKQPNVGHAAER